MHARTDTAWAGQFRLLAAGQGLSWLGDALIPVALTIAIVADGGAASELGVVLAAGTAARVACMLFGGVWADRVPPRPLMIGCDLIRAATAALIAYEFAAGRAGIAVLAGLYVVNGAAAAFFEPAMTSLKALVVPAEHRQRTNATLGTLQSLATVLGPALAGVLVTVMDAGWAFAANAGTYAISAVTLTRLHATHQNRRGESMLTDLRRGWAEVVARDWYWKNLIGHGAWNCAFGAASVLGAIIAVERLGGTAALSAISTAVGVGGIAGGIAAIRFKVRRPLLVGNLGLALGAVLVASYVVPGVLWVVIVAAVLAMCGLAFLNACWDTLTQNEVPHDALGRVSSWDMLTSFVGIPIGNALAGPLATLFGTDAVMLGAAAVIATASLAPLLVRSVRELDGKYASEVPAES